MILDMSNQSYINCYFPAAKEHRTFATEFLIQAGIVKSHVNDIITINEDIEIFTSYMHVLRDRCKPKDKLLQMEITKLAKKYPLANLKIQYHITDEYNCVYTNYWVPATQSLKVPLKLYCKKIGEILSYKWSIQYSLELIDAEYDKVLLREYARAASLCGIYENIYDLPCYFELRQGLFKCIYISQKHSHTQLQLPHICLIYDNTYFNIISSDILLLLMKFIIKI